MGSKKYKGKPCVYCVDGISIDGEHIISRKFFPEEFRDNLPKAPSCKQCNSDKSKLEHYLTAVLPFSSDHWSLEFEPVSAGSPTGRQARIELTKK